MLTLAAKQGIVGKLTASRGGSKRQVVRVTAGSESIMKPHTPIQNIKELRVRLMHLERPTRAGGKLHIRLAANRVVPTLSFEHDYGNNHKASIALLGFSGGKYWGMFTDKQRCIHCKVMTMEELVERVSAFLAIFIKPHEEEKDTLTLLREHVQESLNKGWSDYDI